MRGREIRVGNVEGVEITTKVISQRGASKSVIQQPTISLERRNLKLVVDKVL